MTATTADGGALQRIDALDGVRGLAVAMVLLYHAGVPATGGFIFQSGVDLFFVLSGFLITSILLRTRDHESYFRLFYGRRFLRIFPLYYLVLAVFVGGAALLVHFDAAATFGFPEAASLVQHQWWGWLFQVNNLEAFRGESAFPGLAHLWSLSIEEQFYVVWPLVVLKAPRRWLLRISLGIAAASMLLRCGLYPAFGRDMAYYLTFTRFDGIALGAAGAVVVRSPDLYERVRPAVEWIGRRWWVVFVLLIMPEQAALYVGFTVLSVGYLGSILAAREGVLAPRPTRWLHSKLLLEFGKYSFAMYIFSVPIAQNFNKFTPTNVPLLDSSMHIVVVSAVSYGLARLSWWAWESPWLRLKRRFAYT
ncbi:MAG: acyltransferase family protein [Actinomycetes bacterium]